MLRDGIAHLAEGDERARGGGETRRPLSPSPGRPPRRGALTGRQVDARARAGAERVDCWRTERDRVRRALRRGTGSAALGRSTDACPLVPHVPARRGLVARGGGPGGGGPAADRDRSHPASGPPRRHHARGRRSQSRAAAAGRTPPGGARCAGRGVRDLGTGGPADPDRRLALCLRPRGPAAGASPRHRPGRGGGGVLARGAGVRGAAGIGPAPVFLRPRRARPWRAGVKSLGRLATRRGTS